MVMKGLQPSTMYDIFCTTNNFDDDTMSLADTLMSKVSVLTACCKAIEALQSFSVVASFTSALATSENEDEFQVILNSAPMTNVIVELSIIPKPCGTSSNKYFKAILRPTKFSFNQLSTSLVMAFVVRATIGCYTIDVKAAKSKEYMPLSLAVEVVNSDEYKRIKLAPPVLLNAIIADNGVNLFVYFSAPTDRGEKNIPNFWGRFPCKYLLLLVGSNNASCIWSSSSILTVHITVAANLLIGSDLYLLGGIIKAALSCKVSGPCMNETTSAVLPTTYRISPPLNPAVR